MAYANNNGVQIYYECHGQGRPLMLHHGRLNSARVWHRATYIEALQRGRQLIALDARGHGRSDKPHDPAQYTAKVMASDMVAVLDDLGIEKADLFGYSMGGRIGFMGLAYFAERFSSLIAGGAAPYGPTVSRERELALAASLQNGMAGYLLEMEAMLARKTPEPDRSERLAMDATAVHAMTSQGADWPVVVNEVMAANRPIQLFGGTADPLWPIIQKGHRELPGSRLHALEGLGHSEALLKSGGVVPIVDEFLDWVVAAG
ncbi:MAG: alpha/beta fold hydrolase [Burkholderiaceae bacterium]